MSSFFSHFKEGMELFGGNLAIIVNSVLLTIVYVLGVGGTWLVSRIVGKQFLIMSRDKKAKSYWEDLQLGEREVHEHYRQF